MIKPPTKKLGAETRGMSKSEKRMRANGWNANMLWKYLCANEAGFRMSSVHLWRLVKGDSPWPTDALRQRCNEITGAGF